MTTKWFLLASCAVLFFALHPQAAFAQSGVDAANKPFQMEGDATTTGTICFLPVANGGPAFAAPGSYPPGNSACPTVNFSGSSATWTLVTYGASSDDWDLVFSHTSHSLATAFSTDAVNTTSDNAFLGTSSSLSANINTWTWNPHKSQGKDDIAHSMAAAYSLANGDIGVYMAMDRFDNSGSSIAGFILVQDSNFDLCTGNGLGANGPNANCTATNTFVGHSTVGDLLILAQFTQGGAVSTIDVFSWNGTTMVLNTTRSPAPCDPTIGTSTLCGLTNNQVVQVVTRQGNTVLSPVNTTSPWSFSDKGGQTSFALGEFIELAIDLNAVLGSNLPCFTRVMALTSSSQAVGLNDSLSDLTAPVNFPLCGAKITKSCTGAHILGDGVTVEYDFGGTITNSGIAGLTNVCVTDTPPAVATSLSVTQPSVCTSGTLASQGTANYSGSFETTVILSQQQNEATVNATSAGGTAISPANGFWLNGQNATLCTPPEHGALTLTKMCTGTTINPSTLAITVSYTGTLTNDTNHSSNVLISGISVTDTPAGGIATAVACLNGNNPVTSLAPGASCSYSGSYTATQCTADANGRCDFDDTAKASGNGALGVGTVNAPNAMGTCHLCPLGACAATSP